MPIKILGNYAKAYSRVIREAMSGIWMGDPVMGNFPIEYSEHAGPIRNVPSDTPLDHHMFKASFSADLAIDTLRNTDIDAHTEFIQKLSQAEEEAVGPVLFRTMSQVSDAVGLSIDAAGKSLIDAYLDSLENLDITFDDQGNPSKLQIVVGPDTAERMKTLPPETEEQKQRYESIIDRKRAEYYAKKRTRRLY